MSLDFKNTCPEIDDCIEDYKYNAESFVINLIEHFIPTDLQDSNHWRFKSFVEDKLKELNRDILPLFEKLRELNSEMRDVADNQIGDLEDKISEQEEYISELEKQLENEY